MSKVCKTWGQLGTPGTTQLQQDFQPVPCSCPNVETPATLGQQTQIM
ncbi:hypothetical protein GNE08_26210 [Trichormus variabilis ARAD]|uniref:Uncharacterized protein n=1 Tax=Trichormus variabilis N2B TaxID=2681315 RepID=A0ABR6S4F5_ANAVA|nr:MULTISPECIES: hypothetical protein [Nostocaceae]MBC1217693.1 hypothetical protein [Trichormus variabilis ARAD]MBC1259023.1 hypothetical protein [Trichormus variabilis V5]MBC1269210.1 hypothetical protein [Trichormus variabilis FSR]MBC1301279.1 hypothetical protein [Trichormus variabilis N2B]MBC1309793.1 hypothetical protein [Trichormus variabilis PNB]